MGVNITQASASQGEVTQPFISAYSSPVMFQTQEARMLSSSYIKKHCNFYNSFCLLF